MRSNASFCVVGSGIIGLSSAYCLAKRFKGCSITIIAGKLPPYTTSDHSFGICSLRSLDVFDSENTIRWTKTTGDHLKAVLRSSVNAKEMGISEEKAFLAYHKENLKEDSNSAPVLDTFSFTRELSINEIKRLNFDEHGLSAVFGRENIKNEDLVVYEAGTWIIDNHSYLPWLRKEIELMEIRGEISKFCLMEKKISDFSEASNGCDFIVNCSGLGSENLVPDEEMMPLRGQYIIAERKGDFELRYGGHTFVCPKPDRVALGSIYQVGRRDTQLDPNDTADLLRRCSAMHPDVPNWKIIKEDVGIRPGRFGGARVDLEWRQIGASNVPIIHNYGHGSKGIMQHWGCAQDVVKLAERVLTMQSKL